MANPRQKSSFNRINAVWLMNAASLAAVMTAVSYVAQSNGKSRLTNFLVPQAKANNFYWAGGSDFKASVALWSGSNASASTNPDFTNTCSGLANAWGGTNNTNAAFNTADNLWFGSQPTTITGWTWTNTISLGSSNVSIGSFNFLSGSSNYTFSATNTKKFNIGLATQTQAAVTNNSSSAMTFNVIIAAQGGLSSTSATTFAQNTTNGSLTFSGSTVASSYIINPYAYDWALAQAGTTAAQAKTFAASSSANQALTAADGNSGSRYVKLAGIGTITVGAAIGDAFRGNMGSSTSPFRSNGSTNLVIVNTGTTNLFGWNTYTGNTTIGDGTASGGNVIVGTPYAFGGNRVTDTTAPTGSSATAYTAGTVATGVSINTQAFGTVTVNSGFSIDLNGVNMLGANQLSLTGSGSLSSGVIKNTSTNSATYAGLVVVTNTSTMSTSFGNITFSGGLNTSSKTLTIDGASNTYITGPITGSSGGRIQKTGNGTLTLSGTNSAPYTLKVVAGNVVVTNPDALSTVGTSSILDSGASASDTGTLILTGGLSNSNAYRVGTITPGGNLTISTVGGDSTLTIDGASGSGQSGTVEKKLNINAGVNVIISGSFDLIGTSTTASRYFGVSGDGNLTINGVVRNNSTQPIKGGIDRFSGNGTLYLNGANTFDYGVIFGAGTINVGSAENPGVSGPLGISGDLIMNGGYLQYSANNQYDYSSRFTLTSSNPQKYNVDTNGQTVTWASALTSSGGSLSKKGLGTLILSGSNTYDGGTTLAGGSLRLDSLNAIGSTGTISFTGGALQFTATNTTDYSARFSTAASQYYNLDTNGQSVTLATALVSSGGTLTKSGNGTLTLTTANSYTGDTTVNQGELVASGANVLSSSSSVVVAAGATLNLNSNNQTLKGLAGAGTVSVGTANLTIGDGDSRTFSGDITGNGNVTKSGSGTQTFSTALAYAGSTSINGGVLKVNNNLASSTVTIANGATLEGKGTLSGSVVVSSGGIITAGDSSLADASRGALTLSAITFNGTAVINLANINTNSVSSILNVGALSALGGAGSITINISNTTQLADNSSFAILKYTSIDDFTALVKGTITGTYNRQIKTLVNDTANKQILLTTTGDTLKWTGEGSLTPQWTTSAGNTNWKLSSSGDPADYLAGDIVAFDDTATTFVVTLAEDVTPNGITFNNSTNYTINSTTASSFGILGTSSLTKSGTGRVDINAPLKISGGLTVNNGILSLNNSGNTFTGNVTLNGAGSLELGATGGLNTTNTLTFGSGATGKLSLNGNNATLVGLANDAVTPGTPIIENGSSLTSSTLTLSLASGTSTFDGVLKNGSTQALSLTKTGAGTLLLTANNTLTGLTTISGGTLKLGTGGTSGSVGGDISIGSGATLELNRSDKISFTKILSGSGNFSLKGGQIELLSANTFTGTVALSAGTTLTVGSGGSLLSSVTFTNNGTFEYNNSSSTYSLAAMSGSGNLSILASTVNQTGVNSITGGVSISTGATYAIGTSGSFSSASGVVNNGTLTFGTRSADYTLAQAMSGNGNLISNLGSGRTLFLTGANTYTGTTTINSGIVNMGNGGSTGMIGAAAVTIASGAELQIARSDDITLFNSISGAGKITLGGAGKITLDSTSSINITGELKFGTSAGSAVHSALDLTNASVSVGTFKVQTDATANTALYNSIIIGAGKSLTVNGLTTIGLDNTSNPTTNLTMTGEGTFNIGTSTTATNANVNVGASISASRVNYVNWDMSGLTNLVMNLGTGTFNIGADVNSTGTSNGIGSGVTVKLAKNSTVTATTLTMDSQDALRTFTLSLGSGTNLLNIDTINIAGPTNSRATSQINFNSGDGTLVLRNKVGTGRATLNVQYATNSTGNNQVGLFDVSGHSADLLLGTVIVGERLNLAGAGAGSGSGYLAFDTGTFDATTLNIANKSHNGTATATLVGKTGSSNLSGNIVGLASFGGGNVILGTVDVARHGATTGVSVTPATVQGLIEFLGTNSSTLGAVTIATASSALNYSVTATGLFNVAGGSVYASSISGASATANTSATANVNVSGGTLTLGGNIVRTGGVGTSVFNLNLSGGTLDMGGNAIGSSTSAITFNWTGGTLKNVSGLNGTSGIILNTGNPFTPVYLDGTNTFNSTLTIKDSTLELSSSTALGANSKIAFDGTAGVLKLGTGVAIDVSGNLSSGNAQLDTNGNDITFSNSVSGLTSFTKLGSGKLTISSTSGTLAPTVSILGGIIQLGGGDNQIPVGGFLNGTTALYLDAIAGSPELIANGVKVDLNADVTLSNSGATLSGSKGTSAYSFNFKKDIIIQDNATATLSASNMITGSTSKINVGSGATLTVSGSFIDNTDTQQATQITKNGTGTLEFTGTGNSYSGATTVNAGLLSIAQGAFTNASTTITVNNSGNLTATDLGANVSVTVNSGGTADISGTDITVKDITSQTSSTTALNFSGTSGKVTAQSISGTGAIAFGSDLEVSALNGSGTVILTAATPTLTVSSGSFSGTLTGTASMVKKGSGTLTLSGTNTFTGPVTLTGGIVSVSDFNALGAATDSPENLLFQGGTLKYTGSAATMARDFTVGDGGAGFISSGTGPLVIGQDAQMDFTDGAAANRTLSLGGTTDIAVENIFNPAKIDGADVNNLFTKLVKQDSNKWIVLSAGGFVDNDQTEIDIQNGELGFEMGSLGTKSKITIGSTSQGQTATLGWVGENTEDVSGRINLRAASNAAFDIPTGATVTFASALNGGAANNASVTKTGGGTLVLNETNSFSGGFSISGGTARAAKIGAMGSGTVTVNANATLIVSAVIANTVTVKSGGTLTSDIQNQQIDDTTVEEDGLLLPGGNIIGTMNAHDLTLKGGSIVNWQISNAAGAVVGDYSQAGIGYDTFILNSLALTDASLSKRVHIRVKNIFGEKASNFDKANVQTFKFAKLTNKLSLYDAAHVTDLFEIDATEFEYINGLQTDHLVWNMTVSADREYLYVIAIPEPSTYGLGLGALAIAAVAVRRRKQKSKSATV